MGGGAQILLDGAQKNLSQKVPPYTKAIVGPWIKYTLFKFLKCRLPIPQMYCMSPALT